MAIFDGTPGNDQYFGTAQPDEIGGNDGQDQLRGGSGNDTIRGGNGPDSLYGDRDDDEIYGGTGDDVVRGGRGSDTIFGRYWGAREHHRFLHFEVCYYQAIELAIERRLVRVEAGAQGPHKLTRGYLPVRTYSAHWVRNPSFRSAIARYLEQERAAIDAEIGYLEGHSPFRKS